jgi:YHS domain-containing protein
MEMPSRIITTAGAVLALAMLTAPGVRAESAGDVNQIDGIALHGFDPVAYFTQNKAVKGEAEFTAQYKGVTYEFASKEDLSGESREVRSAIWRLLRLCRQQRVKADIDPHAFAINEGKLYVNYSEKALQAYQGDVKGNTQNANHNWPDVAKQSKIIR